MENRDKTQQRMFLLVIYFIVFISGTLMQAQPYAIGHTTITIVDSSRGNRSISTEIYYPADAAGINVPMSTLNNEKFPVLIFGHGFLMTWDAYQNIWESLVPRGFIMAFPKTEGSISPSHLEYGKDLAYVSNQIYNLSLLANTIFTNRVSLMNAVMGHSMGGGAAFLAAQLNPNIKTIVTLSAAETNPSAVTAATSLTIPALVVAGANDCVTPPGANQLLLYDALNSACKTYVSILGGSHCQMANSNFFCNFGESTCTPQPTITTSVQHTVINDYLVKWLLAELKSDCVSGAAMDVLIENDPRITFQKTCLQCSNLSETLNTLVEEFKIYPIPFGENLHIECHNEGLFEFLLYDASGKKLFSKSFSKKEIIRTSELASGVYFYKIIQANQVLKSAKIVKE